MIEQQRLQYLAALGIETYIPTRMLVHAATSPILVPYEPEIVEDTADQTEVIEPPIDLPQPVVEIVADKEAQIEATQSLSEALAEPVAEPPVNITPSANAAPLRFTLSLWTITPQLVVIDTRQTGSALPTDKLLQNMLRAMGYPLAQLPPSELIRWPIFKQDPQADNVEEALAMVQANINARCARAEEISLLVMGKTAADCVLAPCDEYTNYEQHLGQRIEHAPWQASLIVLPSLVDILEEPSRKALVWQALQPLVRA